MKTDTKFEQDLYHTVYRTRKLGAALRHSSKDLTRVITSAVAYVAAKHKYICKLEYKCPGDELGFVDAVFICPNTKKPIYAIEIDRANKEWSFKKLEKFADIGVKTYWIRWGGKGIDDDTWREAVYAGVTPLDMTA